MNKIKCIKLLVIFIISLSANSQQNEIQLSERIDDYLTKNEINGFNGAVLIVKDNTIILNKGYGLANKENSRPNTPETVFDICSVTKQFTGAAILKLVEEEKLSVTDSLGLYFKNIPKDKCGITIHQLLTHSAGFGHDIGDGDFDHIPKDEYFEELFNTKLHFKPGTKYSYSNSGYSILGRIIEIVSGKSYEAYLKEKLFDPSGMHDTGYLLPQWSNKAIANEYVYNVINKGNHIEKYKADNKIAWPLKANGGINSTQNDMYKWYLALKNNTVLSEASTEKLIKPYIAEDKEATSYYAYGWTTYQSSRDTKIVMHNGFNGVSYYDFISFPEEDALILFATNSSAREISLIPYRIKKMLFNPGYNPVPISNNEITKLLDYIENYDDNFEKLGEELHSAFRKIINDPVILNRLSGIYMREKQLKKSIYLAELNTNLFPNDGNIWDTLGDIYFRANKIDKAIKSYTKALELGSEDDDCFWCENSTDKLMHLRD